MLRRLLVTLALLGAVVSFASAQRNLGAGELLYYLKTHNGMEDWRAILSGNVTFFLDSGAIEVNVPKQFLITAFDHYGANFDDLGLGCNALEAGMGFCARTSDYRFINFVHEAVVKNFVGDATYNCVVPNDHRWVVKDHRNSTAQNVSSCQTFSQAQQGLNNNWISSANMYKGSNASGSWWKTSFGTRINVTLITPMPAGTWNATMQHFVSAALEDDKPTVGDLVANYGITISGLYTDVGWTPIQQPGGGGGTPPPAGGGPGPYCRDGSTPDQDGLCADGSTPNNDRPGDDETNCWVLDIPCNFRKLFIPTQDWGEQYGALSVSDKAPFGLISWVPTLNCGGSVPGTAWQGCMAGIGQDRYELVDHVNSPGDLSGSLKFRVPNPAHTFGIPVTGSGANQDYFEFDLKDTPYLDLWHRHIRIWLFWVFVGTFVVGAVQRFIS